MSAVSAASRAAELTPPPRAPVRVPGRRPHGAALASALAQRAALWTSGQQTTSSSGSSLRSLLSPHLPGPSLRPTRPAFEAHGFLARVRWRGTSPERATATVSRSPPPKRQNRSSSFVPLKPALPVRLGIVSSRPSCKRLVSPGNHSSPRAHVQPGVEWASAPRGRAPCFPRVARTECSFKGAPCSHAKVLSYHV